MGRASRPTTKDRNSPDITVAGVHPAIIVVVILAGWGLQVALERMVHDPRQKQTLKTVLNLATQVIGLLLIRLLVFGVPRQMPTILGLVTAGLTVVFQDF